MWQPQRNILWPGQPGPPPEQPQRLPGSYLGYQQPLFNQDPTFDYVQFEQQFSQMSFTQPPPPIYGGQPRLQRPPRQNNSGIPSLLDLHVPRPAHLNNGYSRPRLPRANCVPPMLNTSVPPPRITLLQKPRIQIAPRPPPVQPQIQSFEAKEPEEPEIEPEVKVEPEPEIKVKTILKRPASTPSNLSLSANEAENKGLTQVEDLKRREEEYAKVRLRILGSSGLEENIS